MKRFIITIVLVIASNYAVDAANTKYKELPDGSIQYTDQYGNIAVVRVRAANFVLAIKNTEMESVKGFPTLSECRTAKAAAIKKDGKNWDCFPINHD